MNTAGNKQRERLSKTQEKEEYNQCRLHDKEHVQM